MRWRVDTYLAVLVVVFLLGAGGGVAFWRARVVQNVQASALGDTQSAAALAARELDMDVGTIQASLTQLASNPAIGTVFSLRNCSLTFTTDGRLDVVAPDGTVACSSNKTHPTGRVYAGTSWPTATRPRLDTTVTDPETHQPALVLSSPIPGHGAVVAVVYLDRLAPTLADLFGGHRHLEFLITNASGSIALSRSVNPQQWADKPLSGTPFDRSHGARRHDVDGHTRVYSQAAVPTLGWQVYAGASWSEALSSANSLFWDQIIIVLCALAVFMLATVVISRKIASPLRRLSVAVASGLGSADPVEVKGPVELVRLAAEFNTMAATVSRELQARQDAEVRAQELAGTYRDLFDRNPQPMWVFDLDSLRFLDVNEAAVAHYGYNHDEFMTMTIGDIRPPEDLPDVVAAYRASPGLQRVGPWRHQKRDGTLIEVLSTSMTVPFERRNARLVVIEDITERQAFQDRMNQAERLESLGQLAGGVAHDFNNLLGAIMNYAAIVAEETVNQPAVHADAEQIQAAAERGARLTRQLLTFARREPIRREVLDLNRVIADIHELLARSLGEHIHLVVEANASAAAVEADRGQLEQVLVNLAVNARDAMPDGGTLTVETATVDIEDDYVRIHPNARVGPHVQLSVSDTGVGMSRDVVARIFEPFYTTKPVGEGTGLGLATVYGVVTESGGSVSVYSEPDLGTTFRVLLPRASEPALAAETPPTVSTPGHGETILIVDDEPAVMDSTARILRRNGYTVFQAASGGEALEIASSHDLGLLLTDSIMPSMSGQELANQVRHLRPQLPVLFMSGYSQGVIAPESLIEEHESLIQKPFTPQALLERVREVMLGGG